MSQPTAAADVVIPEPEMVAVRSFRDRAGNPVQVLCGAIDPLTVLELIENPPGNGPEVAGAAPGPERVRKVLANEVHPMIELGCKLAGADGELQQAFYFGEAVAGALPGNRLSLTDRTELYQALLRANGYAGGAVEQVRFPDGTAELAEGVVDLDAGQVDGDAPAPPHASAAGPAAA